MKGLYIHIPFCVRKCLYCDFTSFAGCEGEMREYLTALGREAKKYAGECVDTVFIGGGTPSLLSVSDIHFLGDFIHDNFSLTENVEFTAEVNPESVTEEKIKAFSDIGVNRISMGVQSFNDEELKKLGRIHNSDTAVFAAGIIKKYISNFNLDIMTGIPYQTKESLRATLNTAVSLKPNHISAYSLIIEEGTPFFKLYGEGKYVEDEDKDREMYAFTCDFLKKHGYERYEISNFAFPGAECRHNLKYWDCEEYIGLGAAAHSYMNGKRYFNTGNIADYINGKGCPEDSEELSDSDRISEFIIMGMRKANGINLERFSELFGEDIYNMYGKEIKKHITNGFLEEKNGFLYLTPAGIDISNAILCDFV